MGGYFSEYSIDREIIFIYEKSVAPKEFITTLGKNCLKGEGHEKNFIWLFWMVLIFAGGLAHAEIKAGSFSIYPLQAVIFLKEMKV